MSIPKDYGIGDQFKHNGLICLIFKLKFSNFSLISEHQQVVDIINRFPFVELNPYTTL